MNVKCTAKSIKSKVENPTWIAEVVTQMDRLQLHTPLTVQIKFLVNSFTISITCNAFFFQTDIRSFLLLLLPSQWIW